MSSRFRQSADDYRAVCHCCGEPAIVHVFGMWLCSGCVEQWREQARTQQPQEGPKSPRQGTNGLETVAGMGKQQERK